MFDRSDNGRMDVWIDALRKGFRIHDRGENSLVVEALVESHNTINIDSNYINVIIGGWSVVVAILPLQYTVKP